MNMDLEKIVRERKSVRSYDTRPLNPEVRDRLNAAMDEILSEDTPFSAPMRIQWLEGKSGDEPQKLSTYGVIRGAQSFLGVTVKNVPTAPETVGYRFEKLVLKATEMGLGTCWMAGTFNRSQFENAMDIAADELFPIISPIGYPAEKPNLINGLFRNAK